MIYVIYINTERFPNGRYEFKTKEECQEFLKGLTEEEAQQITGTEIRYR